MKKLFFILLLGAVVCALSFSQQNAGQNVSAPQKFALVIGNGNYTGISRLNNPVNDANDMETALKGLGFTVEKVLNGNLDQMENAASNLVRRLGASKYIYGFFFYAGHGVQSGGDNYLIPVDAGNIQTENHLRQRAFSVQTLLDNLNDSGNELNMIVLDACRDNPFGWSRSGSRGLSVVGRAPAGSIIMYATSANSTAADGTGRNGLFTSQLLNNIKNQSLSIRDVFDKTGEDVLSVSGGKQHPELSLRFFGASSAYLGARPAPAAVTQSAPVPAPAPAPMPSPAAQSAPTVQLTPVPTPVPTVQPAPVTSAVPAGFVRINGGTFTMGDSSTGQRQVTISSFNMGKYEVTQKEYQEIMGKNPSIFLRDNFPVERVSWYNAVEYCNKRSMKEGLTPAYTINSVDVTWNRNANGNRLPTEAEWEYACRAGTTTRYNTGKRLTLMQANYNGNRIRTVGKYKANAWGLHDMHGNVWEWCWDWEGDYPSGAQTDPMGASSGSCRVIRGGSWYDSAEISCSANRSSCYPAYSDYYGGSFGFRVVRP